ncbi:thioredoxin domain-containing protein [Pseudaminobacter arsenicus]|uniref:Thioredoxin domain-containing protein n=1 Tax=Borborobacter arsenicus TaxID=1851146 RepID=A0A432V8X1_9HYPH|nr:thioredoxin domain-containing protein [Pseudaminobacter arsenicus]
MPLPPENLLSDETSPYLRQHSHNPVHWRSWSPQSLAEAKELDRPILLSIGYAACHWCHVMAHESFESPEVAAVMNRLFVNIKVDREERPDIDQIYMAALTAMGEQGGWPLTIFLTPDAKPFWGGTYFSKESKYGRPGFIQVLEAIAAAWNAKREDITKSSEALRIHVESRLAGPLRGSANPAGMLDSLAMGIFGMIDHDLGGLRGAPKFPNAPLMQTLWLSWLQTGNEAHRDAVITSLRHMLGGGIYDHIGGGLSRYSTDAEWLVPHFEKMLYDNAQMLRMANWAYAATGDELFRIRIEETVGWLLREMTVEGGGFASSLDADSDGEEGLFYTWNREEIESILEQDSSLFFNSFTLTKPQGWEGKPIVHRSPSQSSRPQADEVIRIKRNLLAVRERRIRPGRDDKALVDWNGLTITALAEVGRSFSRNDWVDAARRAYRFILDCRDADGRLPHSILGTRRLYPALSSDYAAMGNAAVALFEATTERRYLEDAISFMANLDKWHEDDERSGYYLSASDSTDVPIRIRGDVDEAIPSATGQIIEAAARLANALGDTELHLKAWRIAEYAAGRAASQQYGQAGIINAGALAASPMKLVMVEDADKPRFVPAANRSPDPRRVDIVIPLGASSALPSLADGALPPTDKAGAFLCTGRTCLPVITDPKELERALRR